MMTLNSSRLRGFSTYSNKIDKADEAMKCVKKL